MKLILSIFIIFLTLSISSCKKNNATVVITCIGDPINASVDGDEVYINSYSSHSWTIEWDGGLFSSDSKSVNLYAEDWEYPSLYNTSRTLDVKDGKRYTWSIGWSEAISAVPGDAKHKIIEEHINSAN